MAYTKQWLVDLVRRLGYNLNQLQGFGDRHEISRDEVTDAMGGSP